MGRQGRRLPEHPDAVRIWMMFLNGFRQDEIAATYGFRERHVADVLQKKRHPTARMEALVALET